MKFVLCLALCFVVAAAEDCNDLGDCQETECHTQHGWFLQCKGSSPNARRTCVCSHLSYVGKNCSTGMSSQCHTLHGDRCENMNLKWTCLDNQCHCSRYSG